MIPEAGGISYPMHKSVHEIPQHSITCTVEARSLYLKLQKSWDDLWNVNKNKMQWFADFINPDSILNRT